MGRLIGYLIYAWVCFVCLAFVSTPLSLLAAGTGLVVGVGAALVVTAMVMVDTTGTEAVLVPSDPRLARLGPVARRFVRRDLAWPHYFAAQGFLDARNVVAQNRAWVLRVWAATIGWFRARSWGGFWWPLILVPPIVGLAAASLGLAAGVGAVLMVFAVVTAGAWAIGLPVVYTMRSLDAGWRLVLQSASSCDHCYQVAAVPAFRCRGPHTTADRDAGDDLHRDLRPGRLGVLFRRCACGNRLPTMVLRAAFSEQLTACCPHCGESLQSGAGAIRDVRVPVFGAASAGKTQFVMSALVGLHRAAGQAGVELTLPDQRDRQTYAVYADLVARSAAAPKTGTSAPAALTVRIDQGVNTTLLRVFDAAGETLTDREQNAQLAYLDHAEGLIFVLDPFSVPRLRDEYETSYPNVFTEANAALHDPEDSYNATVQRLQEYGVRTGRRRLAFVVTKADLLGRLPLPLPPDRPDEVRAWLAGIGLDNLLLAADRDFREVRFALVSGRDTGPDGPTATLRWLMRKGWGNLG